VTSKPSVASHAASRPVPQARSIANGFGDRDVRLVRTEPVVRALGFEAALPDGMHFSVLGHRMVGELLTAEVLDWLGQRSDENAIAADLLLRQTR